MVFGVETSLLDGKLRTGDIITVPASETWDGNLYLFAGQVTVDGNVNGDLVAFGGTIADERRGNRRCASWPAAACWWSAPWTATCALQAATMEITGSAAGDVLVTGGRVTLVAGSSVGGDVIVSGGTGDGRRRRGRQRVGMRGHLQQQRRDRRREQGRSS